MPHNLLIPTKEYTGTEITASTKENKICYRNDEELTPGLSKTIWIELVEELEKHLKNDIELASLRGEFACEDAQEDPQLVQGDYMQG